MPAAASLIVATAMLTFMLTEIGAGPNQPPDGMTGSASSRLFQGVRQWRAPRHRSAFR